MVNRCIVGNCLDVLPTLEAGSVQTCVTSPPYWGLRDYGTAKWEGGDAECDHRSPTMREGRNENRAMLAGSDATNGAQLLLAHRTGCGKCGAVKVDSQIGLESTPDEFVAKLVAVFREVRRVLRDDGTLWLNLGDSYASAWVCNRRSEIGSGSLENGKRADRPNRLVGGLKEKDLVGIPWRVAFALQADGWYLRQDIIWHKPNPMPESVRDRCTKAHEYIFLLSKNERYYFDSDAIAEPAGDDMRRPYGSPGANALDARGEQGAGKPRSMKAVSGSRLRQDEGRWNENGGRGFIPDGLTRNKRSVWTVTTKPFSGAHFATFPPDLIEPCILAGSRPGDVVLDPFGGSGTTGMVSESLGRRWLLIELNPAYEQLSRERTAQQGLVLA